MRFWLDDERDPRDPTVQELFGAVGDETWVKSPGEFWSLFISNLGNVVSVSFDNDLSLFGDSPEVTCVPEDSPVSGATEGRHIMRALEEMAFHGDLPRMCLYVHTANRVARVDMQKAVENIHRFWDRSGK